MGRCYAIRNLHCQVEQFSWGIDWGDRGATLVFPHHGGQIGW